ncbi:VOC family protein [Bradyrhizobium sp. SYSU BS000235]|uniref:VOC family protein n=1 Tax=Bradyrhizobium sp. SYSU BS000235 TaxID=3411332 RepID=UPI003C7408BC
MSRKAKPIPDGFDTVTPYIVADDANEVIHFMQKAFGAELDHPPMKRPDGRIMHATMKVGSSRVMLADSSDRAMASPVMLYVYVPDVDSVYQSALAAGGTSIMEPSDMFYGDRSGGVTDVAGNQWFIGTRIEDIAPEELQKRADAMFKDNAA